MPIYVDNREFPEAPEKNLLEHCLILGFDLPYFCWHPAMGSVGACRQCAVKQYGDENDTQGRIVMACMTPAADGTRIGLHEAEATDFRARVIEWLMVNHPHDCPVCEEGGECHLQDMTVMTGHNYRRYRGLKRTFRNQYLGPFINHEMNRCIACYRCVRFYQDYAGGDDLRAFAAHHHVYFGRHADGVLDSEFSGNLAEVCPTGVFTDKPFSDRYVRKWDLQSAPSICPHCSLGCNISPQERYGRLRRVVNRYNGDVNEYFICDRGRFGYGFVNADSRIRAPLLREAGGDALEPAEADAALERAAGTLGGRVIGIGSPRASLEANHALRRLVGVENFYAGVSGTDGRTLAAAAAILTGGTIRSPSLSETNDADAVLVLGEDPTQTAPRLALALHQAARNRQKAVAAGMNIPAWLDQAVRTAGQDAHTPFFVAAPSGTRLDRLATSVWREAPESLARLGFAVAHRLDAAAPDAAGLPDAAASLADRIAEALAAAERPLVVSGTGARSEAVLEAAANVAGALGRRRGRPADLALALPESNSLGLALLDAPPLDAALERARSDGVDAAIVLENDIERRAGSAALRQLRADVERLVVVDHTRHATADAADVVLPAAAFAEGDGTLVNNEGRAQRFFQAYVPEGEIRESWRWLGELLERSGSRAWHTLDEASADCARSLPVFASIPDAAPSASFRIAGRSINRAPHRYSGRTAMHANVEIREPKPPADPDAPLAFSMEGYYGPRVPPALIPYFWAPRWNSVQSVHKFQDETGRHLRGGDPGVRLLEPTGAEPRWFEPPDPPAGDGDGRLRVVAIHHIFGSEELSALSPPVAERIDAPYVALHPDDADARGLADGDAANVALDELTLTLPVRRDETLARGALGLPFALPGMPASDARTGTVDAAGAADGGGR